MTAEPSSSPTTPAATRERILDAAEELFGRDGVAHTSTRAILRAARQRNESALQYHFGGRDGLIAALHARRMEQVEQLRQARLARIDPEARLGVRQIVEIQITPFVEMAQLDPGFVHYLRAIGEVAFSPRAQLLELVGRYEVTSDARLRSYVERAGGDLSGDVLDRRSDMARRFMILSLSQWAREHGRFDGPETKRFLTDLIDMLAAMFTAGRTRGPDPQPSSSASQPDPSSTSRTAD